jgi:ribose-phosphate pyrophosphokinase
MKAAHILAFPESYALAASTARLIGAPISVADVHRFPDGETRVRLPAHLPEVVVLLRSLDRPNEKLVELMLAARTARELGVRHLVLVAPYLCYMRQDVAFVPGEGVSQRIVGRFLADLFDSVVAVDPHLHRVRELREAIPARHCVAVSAAPAIGRFLRTRFEDAVVVGPDEESAQWAETVARSAGWEFVVARKVRTGDRHVTVKLPDKSFAGRVVVLVDDMISTGHTMADCARMLLERGARTVSCAVTHALCGKETIRMLHGAGVQDVWSSDSVACAGGTIELAPLLASAIEQLPDQPELLHG